MSHQETLFTCPKCFEKFTRKQLRKHLRDTHGITKVPKSLLSTPAENTTKICPVCCGDGGIGGNCFKCAGSGWIAANRT